MSDQEREFERQLEHKLTLQASRANVSQPELSEITRRRSAIHRQRWTGRVALAAALLAVAVGAGSLLQQTPADTEVEASSGVVTRGRFNCVRGEPDKSTHVIVWLAPGATDEDRAQVERRLVANSVLGLRYFSPAETLSELRELWADNPELLEGLDEAELPASFRLSIGRQELTTDFGVGLEPIVTVQFTPFDEVCGLTVSDRSPPDSSETLRDFCEAKTDEEAFELIVWMDVNAANSAVSALALKLETMPEVAQSTYMNRELTYREFEEYWQDSPELVAAVQPEDLPTSFRVLSRSRQGLELISNEIRGYADVLGADLPMDPAEFCDDGGGNAIHNWLESILS